MSNQFEVLDQDEVVIVKEEYCKILIGQPTFRPRELSQKAIQILSIHDEFSTNTGWSKNQQPWVTEGVTAKVLRYGAKDWQQGKVKMRIVVEFCPDEPEVEEIAVPNEPESLRETESPLDDIRRMIDEPTPEM